MEDTGKNIVAMVASLVVSLIKPRLVGGENGVSFNYCWDLRALTTPTPLLGAGTRYLEISIR